MFKSHILCWNIIQSAFDRPREKVINLSSSRADLWSDRLPSFHFVFLPFPSLISHPFHFHRLLSFAASSLVVRRSCSFHCLRSQLSGLGSFFWWHSLAHTVDEVYRVDSTDIGMLWNVILPSDLFGSSSVFVVVVVSVDVESSEKRSKEREKWKTWRMIRENKFI